MSMNKRFIILSLLLVLTLQIQNGIRVVEYQTTDKIKDTDSAYLLSFFNKINIASYQFDNIQKVKNTSLSLKLLAGQSQSKINIDDITIAINNKQETSVTLKSSFTFTIEGKAQQDQNKGTISLIYEISELSVKKQFLENIIYDIIVSYNVKLSTYTYEGENKEEIKKILDDVENQEFITESIKSNFSSFFSNITSSMINNEKKILLGNNRSINLTWKSTQGQVSKYTAQIADSYNKEIIVSEFNPDIKQSRYQLFLDSTLLDELLYSKLENTNSEFIINKNSKYPNSLGDSWKVKDLQPIFNNIIKKVDINKEYELQCTTKSMTTLPISEIFYKCGFLVDGASALIYEFDAILRFKFSLGDGFKNKLDVIISSVRLYDISFTDSNIDEFPDTHYLQTFLSNIFHEYVRINEFSKLIIAQIQLESNYSFEIIKTKNANGLLIYEIKPVEEKEELIN